MENKDFDLRGKLKVRSAKEDECESFTDILFPRKNQRAGD